MLQGRNFSATNGGRRSKCDFYPSLRVVVLYSLSLATSGVTLREPIRFLGRCFVKIDEVHVTRINLTNFYGMALRVFEAESIKNSQLVAEHKKLQRPMLHATTG